MLECFLFCKTNKYCFVLKAMASVSLPMQSHAPEGEQLQVSNSIRPTLISTAGNLADSSPAMLGLSGPARRLFRRRCRRARLSSGRTKHLAGGDPVFSCKFIILREGMKTGCVVADHK